ncbi:ribosome assembly factor SBDS [Candidatus Woesearchaeota archaeon]|nr:ribosome assembly factor SBDS [Candidatus Woesearchaeota archaeon]
MSHRITYDKERIHLNLARLKKGGEIFEIDIDPDKAIEFKEGKNVDIKDILKAEKVFSDAKKGLLASEERMKSLFGTDDPIEVAKVIIEDGEVQLTAEYRQMVRDNKRKRIIEIIHRNGIEPKSGLPHPLQRLENAFAEAKIKIDEFAPEEKQVQEIMKKLKPILPIKFEVREIEVIIGAEYAAKAYPTVKSFGKLLRDQWQSDGSWRCVIEIPAGMQEDFFDKLNSMTHGEVQTKLLASR